MTAVIEVDISGPVVEVEVPGIQGPAGDPLDFGGQIPFPAIQNASADANTLDDYEEGTFTPAFTAAVAPSGVTYSTQLGFYTKIGNRVFYSQSVALTSKGTGGANSIILTGLPFVPSSAVVHVTAIRVSNLTFLSGYTAPLALPQTNATILIGLNGSGVVNVNPSWGDAVDTSQFRITGSYNVD